jgi:glycosyltransferase involved in cell wall biosynthesis
MTAASQPTANTADLRDRPLRIVHYVPGIRLEQGGVVRAILDWCTVFSQRGHAMTLVTYQGNDLPKEWLSGKPNLPRAFVVPEPTLPGKPLNGVAMKVAEDALRNADVLHLHAPWLDGNRQWANLARKLGVPYIVSAHGMLDDWAMTQRPLKKKIYPTLFGRRLLNNAAAIHCTAEAEWEQASQWFSNRRKAVLPYLVDLKPFENLPGPEAGLSLLPVELRDKPKILFLSRLHEQKGVDILIRAAGILRDQGLAFSVMIAGTGDAPHEKLLNDLTDELNLRDRVFLLGLVTGDKKISVYQAADIFVLPTHHENFGLVLTEALACGTPVITTKGTDIWNEVQSAGGVIAQTTPQSIADAIKQLLANAADLPQLGRRGREWAFATLAVEPLAQRYEELYRALARPA